jgi:2-methylcitrate dehydratase PrpD
LLDADIAELSERVSVIEDEELGDLVTKLEIVYEDGSRELRTCDAPLGEPSNPLSAKHIRQKYFSLAVPVLGAKKAESVESLVGSIEERVVSELMALVASSV